MRRTRKHYGARNIRGDNNPRSTLPTLATIAAVLIVLTSACNLWGELPFFYIVNDTDQDLVLTSVNSNGQELELDVVEPGERFSEQTGDCYPAEIVARTTDGDDYARQGPRQLCPDDTWTITEPDT